ncbi:MAG: IS630 family transposase [Verrucomicrobiota bacterium]
MGRKRERLDIHNQGEEVQRRLKTEKSVVVRERLLAVSIGLKGERSLQEIATDLGRSRATIQTWFDHYRAKGIAGLLPSTATRGFSSALTGKAEKELRKKLTKGSFRRSEDARIWLEQKHGICFCQGYVRALLGKLGARLKVVRPRHPKSLEIEREHFRTQLARRMFTALKSQHPDKQWKERPVRIWIADEARFGLQPCLKRAWVTRGIQAHKSSLVRYKWRYVWGALEVDGTESAYLYTDAADTEVSLSFLELISAKDPQAEHLVIWDGAGFHPNGEHPRIPENVTVLRQPSYSPELNCVEKLWDMLRDGLCNRAWKDIDELLEHATKWLREFWEDHSRIKSLVGQGWLLHQTNV